jgi:polyisoprenoid-binding protein YceI
MTKFLVTSLTSLIAASAMAATPASKIPAGTFKIDAAHSKVGFEVAHLVVSSVEGRFNKVEGDLDLNKSLDKSKANITIDVTSIDTANKDRDDHLKSPDFFDAAKSPKMTFVSKKVVAKGDGLQLIGDLTIKGKTKEVALDVVYNGETKDFTGKQVISFTATGKINRKDFGLTWNKMLEAGPAVGDEVTLTIKVEADKKG